MKTRIVFQNKNSKRGKIRKEEEETDKNKQKIQFLTLIEKGIQKRSRISLNISLKFKGET